MELTRKMAERWDQEDPLSSYREEFYLTEGRIYLDGNSLGLMSKRAEQACLEVLNSWREYGIDGWTEGRYPWFELAEELGEKSAPLVGAEPEEVIVTGSTTVNLHQLLATFYQPEGKRTKILADALTFPSDIYAMQSHLRLHGLDPEKHLIQVASRDGQLLDEEDLIAAMTDEVAIIVLPSVLYRSGQVLDMKRLTEAARRRGIPIGFDLCHSVGAIPHHLHDWGVDFAFWCNYKYLNGGPGAVASLFVHEKHFGGQPGLAGWFSSDKGVQFDMDHRLVPAADAGAFQIGTPHILSLSPFIGSLEIFNETGIERIRKKSLKQTRFLMELVEQKLGEWGFSFGNPVEDERRGGHICLVHREAVRICKSLKEKGVVPDFRPPDAIRLAPVALYTSYTEIWDAVRILKEIMEIQDYRRHEGRREVVS